MAEFVHIEKELIELGKTYNTLSIDYGTELFKSVRKRHELDMMRATEMLKVDPKMTVDRRKATVDLLCDALELETHLAEATVEAIKMRMRSVDVQMSGAQTRGRFLTAEITHFNGTT